jgi:tetratricopeptide (TPR) repeat protein
LYSSIREEAMAKAEQLMAERNYSGARAIYQQILEVDTGIDNVKALCQLSRIWLDAGKGDKALELAQKALGLSAKDRSLPLQLIGEAYLILGQHELAVTHLEDSETKMAAFILAKALHEYAVSLAPTDELYSQQVHQRCAGHVMEIVEKDSDSWEGLFWYSQLALDQGLVEDSIRVALRLLVRRKDSTDIKHLLANGISSPDGFEILIKELGSGAESASALAFLATTMKDASSLDASLGLFKRATAIDPNPNYLLNYLHAMELDQSSYEIALVAADYLESKCKISIPDLDLGPISALLRRLGPTDDSLSWYRSEQGASPSRALAPNPPSSPKADEAKIDYSSEQLDLLAILFTVTKVLYVTGALGTASELVALVNPLKHASRVELHHTSIRNEAAYFSCIAQILTEHPPPSDPGSTKEVFLIGDSHCLSSAWRTVELDGEPHIVHPLLVTGCKIWHLRPSSRFYPKLQFFHAVAKVPRGSPVILILGEIDCREGFLLAVQRSKYESLEEAVEATVDIYLELLLSLIKTLDLRILVHPVPPVLDPTRPIVIKFMETLEQKLAKAGNPKLHLLHFFDQLMEPGPEGSHKLRADLTLDGTHLSPRYVQLLNQSLSQHSFS